MNCETLNKFNIKYNRSTFKTDIDFNRFRWILINFENTFHEIYSLHNYSHLSEEHLKDYQFYHIENKKEIKILSFNILINLLNYNHHIRLYSDRDITKLIITIIVISIKFLCELIDINYNNIVHAYSNRFKSKSIDYVRLEIVILNYINWNIKYFHTCNYLQDHEIDYIYNDINPFNHIWLDNIYFICSNNSNF